MILLIGNFLSKHGLNPTAIEDLALSLSEKYTIVTASDKLNSLHRLWDMICCIVKHRKSCKLIIVDVFSTNAFIYSALVIQLARIFKIRFHPVFRGGYLAEKYKKYPKIFHYLFQSPVVSICPSMFFLEKFKHGPFYMKLIPNYISLEEYPYKKRQQFYPKVLWVRSIHPIYNPEMAIDVIAQLNQDHPQVKLCMVGPVKDKALFDKLQEKIRVLQLEDCIQFTGQLSKNKWSAIARDYDIFINTSNIDNTPVSIMEAMALGLPIVSTNVGGIPYLIDDGVTGLLINSSDSDQMAEKINELISGKIDGDFITRNARQRISIMDKKEIIKKWYDIIDDAVLYIK